MYLFGHVFVAVCELSLVVASGATPCSHVWASHCADFSSFRPPALGTQASVVVAHGHSCPVASPQTIDRTHVLCIGRWIPFHSTTREVRPQFTSALPKYVVDPVHTLRS